MKSARLSILLVSLLGAAAEGQLRVSEVTPVVRHPHHFTGLRVADVDGDGDEDLLVHGSGALSAMCVNDGGGGFSPPVALDISHRRSNYYTPRFADLLGDGFPEVLISDSGLILWNRTGSFEPSDVLPGGDPLPSLDEDPLPPFSEFLAVLPGPPDRLIVSRTDELGQKEWFLYGLDPDGGHEIVPITIDGEAAKSLEWDSDLIRVLPDVDGSGNFGLAISVTGEFQVLLRHTGGAAFTRLGLLPAVHLDAPLATLRLAGESHPVIAHLQTGLAGESLGSIIRFRSMDETGGELLLASSDHPHAIDLANPEGVSYRQCGGMVAVATGETPTEDELWIRMNSWEGAPTLLCYRHDPESGWFKHVEVRVPGIGLGDLQLMRPAPSGPLGFVLRLGGERHTSANSEATAIWASLDSLRNGEPEWRSLVGPFCDFSDIRIGDLDLDGEPDLISGQGSHGLGYGPGGRFHLIFGIGTENHPEVIHTESETWFGSVSPLEGNKTVIGHADSDLLPDLAVSNGQATAIRILRNLGNRSFEIGPPITGLPDAMSRVSIPLRLDPHQGMLFFDGQTLAAKPPLTTDDPILLHDLGTPGSVVFTDMDSDGIGDVVASPCPLGRVTGWGKRNAEGDIVSWQLLRPVEGKEIRDSGGVPSMGILIDGATSEFVELREGLPGIRVHTLPSPLPASDSLYQIWPPLDLDGDGDFDLLRLQYPGFNLNGDRNLIWHENAGNRWISHAETPLFRTWVSSTVPHSVTAQRMTQEPGTRILFGTGEGEVFLLDFDAPVPGGEFGQQLASHGLRGASAGAHSDPDGDGLTNLEEILQGTSPVAPDARPFSIPVGRDASGGWRFSTAIRLTEASGIRLVAETSPDLQTWSPIGAGPEEIGERDGHFDHHLADPGTDESRRFLRLRFRWEEDGEPAP